jgi:hypothetical protein
MPSRVYIFDGVDGDDTATMNQRVAVCYAWAEHHGLTVVDEIISWAARTSPGREVALSRAVVACRRERAALLVHSDAVLPNDDESHRRPAPDLLLSVLPPIR